ncbi:hypothetical protein [Xylanimonas cellulosilytica]|nr:hypothetical protein [Xylanimonas cellulosilytica]
MAPPPPSTLVRAGAADAGAVGAAGEVVTDAAPPLMGAHAGAMLPLAWP